MKQLIILGCLILVVAGGKEKQISLEDIERDYLASERQAKQETTTSKPSPKPAAPSPTQYGFVPVKSSSAYRQQDPKPQYLQPQYTLPAQYPISEKYETAQIYAQPQSGTPQYTPVHEYTPEKYEYAQPTQYQAYQPTGYQQYENIQYITDNSIQNQPSPQYQYQPQYVYLHTAPSNAIQTVVDPKAGYQYIMYVPTYVPTQHASPTYENVVYTVAPQAPQEEYPQPQQVDYKPPGRKEPKSLLDSYIPSYLQVQYYKQQQLQANSLPTTVKINQPLSGKVEYVKQPTQYKTSSQDSTLKYTSSYQSPSSYLP